LFSISVLLIVLNFDNAVITKRNTIETNSVVRRETTTVFLFRLLSQNFAETVTLPDLEKDWFNVSYIIKLWHYSLPGLKKPFANQSETFRFFDIEIAILSKYEILIW